MFAGSPGLAASFSICLATLRHSARARSFRPLQSFDTVGSSALRRWKVTGPAAETGRRWLSWRLPDRCFDVATGVPDFFVESGSRWQRQGVLKMVSKHMACLVALFGCVTACSMEKDEMARVTSPCETSEHHLSKLFLSGTRTILPSTEIGVVWSPSLSRTALAANLPPLGGQADYVSCNRFSSSSS